MYTRCPAQVYNWAVLSLGIQRSLLSLINLSLFIWLINLLLRLLKHEVIHYFQAFVSFCYCSYCASVIRAVSSKQMSETFFSWTVFMFYSFLLRLWVPPVI